MEPQRLCPWCMGELSGRFVTCPSCGRDPRACTSMEHQLQPHTVLQGRYLLGRVLGQGGFGITYLGFDLTLQRRVAVKEFFPPSSARSADGSVYTYAQDGSLERGKEAFLREARAMSRASGIAAVAGVHDFFAANGTAYLVMEYVEGATLGDWATRFPGNRAPSSQLLPLLRPVAEGLETLHGAGVVHRDISPNNIMVDATGRARLIDFGLARGYDATTLTSAVNPGFAPVEQWTGSGQGPWTDVYALCATIYACLTGLTPPSSVERLTSDALVPPCRAGADINEMQEVALLRGLAPQPQDRTRSMGELLGGLFGNRANPERQIPVASSPADNTTHDGATVPRAPEPRHAAGPGGAMGGTVPPDEAAPAGKADNVQETTLRVKRPEGVLDAADSTSSGRGSTLTRRALIGGTVALVAATAGLVVWRKDDVLLLLSPSPWKNVTSVACGEDHTVGVRANGACVACGSNDSGQTDVEGWSDVAAVACGSKHTVGVRTDGTCVACGDVADGQCDVSGWSDIVSVACGWVHTVGLKKDGTCVACGDNSEDQCEVEGWSNLVAVEGGWLHTVGVRDDGTCVACGRGEELQCDVSGWTDIVAVGCGGEHTVGLRRDGTCVACGSNNYGQCDIEGWSDIAAIACGWAGTIGLKADGTCVACGNNSFGQIDVDDWSDIVAVSSGLYHTVGVRGNGTCVACGSENYGRCDVSALKG